MKREIKNELVAYIDKKLANNPVAQAALRAKDARTLTVLAAEACVGIREATGKNDGKLVRLIQSTIGGASGEPYCIGGVQSCIAYAEVKTGISSALIATELATALWDNTPSKLRVKGVPLPGAIAVWQDRNPKTKSLKTSGHGEIVRHAGDKTWNGVGFNTSGALEPGGPIVTEGNGVYFTARNYLDRSTRVLLGFIKPF